jgi:hypothetical protein
MFCLCTKKFIIDSSIDKHVKHVILVPKETLADKNQMKDILLDAVSEGHEGGNLCATGYSIEFQLEEDAMKFATQDDTKVFKVDPESKKIIR